MTLALGEIVDALGGELLGARDVLIAGIASLEMAGPNQIAFLSNPKYQQQLQLSNAACVPLHCVHATLFVLCKTDSALEAKAAGCSNACGSFECSC
jgi:UDP-3-O-[3-hydroxymyristoyl] glucosamine N-acyltransferase